MRSRAGTRPASDQDLASRPAVARDRPLAVCRIVVGQLLAFADVASRDDPDRVANHARVAVRLARMIDVASDVAADSGITHVQAIELETPDVALLQVPRLALQALLVGDLLAVVSDDALVFGNGLSGKNAPALDRGVSFFDHVPMRVPPAPAIVTQGSRSLCYSRRDGRHCPR